MKPPNPTEAQERLYRLHGATVPTPAETRSLNMNRNQLFPSRFLKAPDLQGRTVVVVIEELSREDVGDDQQQKPVLHFRGKAKGLVLNATNYDAIADAYGDETDHWPGQPIELYPTKVDFRGSRVDAIRVRIPNGKATPAPKPPPAPPAVDFDDSIQFVLAAVAAIPLLAMLLGSGAFVF